jgi:hypothetical protein
MVKTATRKRYDRPVLSESGLARVSQKAVLAYSVRNRHRKADRILALMQDRRAESVLLVGAAGDEHDGDPNMIHSGIIERRITESYSVKMAINIEPIVASYPFMIADACEMPFEDDYGDFAVANAIIEHVGSEADQRRMVNEMTRVARAWVITTPNKWFPVEAHTHAVFLHWFPSWRKKHYSEFTRLLSRREFRALLPPGAKLSGMPWSPTFFASYSRR